MTRNVRSLLVLTLVAAALSACGASAGTHASSQPAGAAIAIKSYKFSPVTLTVKAGSRVTWTNGDADNHTVTTDNGAGIESGTLAHGKSFTMIFAHTGHFPYHCAFHAFMHGNITVR